MLVDVNAAFAPSSGGIASDLLNDARLRAGEVMGITIHIMIMPGGEDSLSRARDDSIRHCVSVDPLRFSKADRPGVDEEAIRRAIGAARPHSAVGIVLEWALPMSGAIAADLIADECARNRLPLRVDDRANIAPLASTHGRTTFVLSALGDDPHWESTVATVAPFSNVAVDLSGRRTERGMLDRALAVLGPERLLWGTGAQMETGLAQLRALDVIAPGADVIEAIRWKNAHRIYPLLRDRA